jgi:7-cyano-7-deazaguanine synthase
MYSSAETTVLFSGGVDSAACAHYLQKRGNRIRALFVDYGQKAAPFEHAAAQQLSAFLHVGLSVIRVVTERSFGGGEITGRNAFLVFASILDDSPPQCQLIALGLHAGTPYYDCSPAFLEATNRLVAEYTDGRTRVIAPFIDWTKRDIFDYALRSDLPLDLAYSCEAGGSVPCGSCLSCRDREMLSC